jgi:LPXTG-site transpeptidase (sortase) family protein
MRRGTTPLTIVRRAATGTLMAALLLAAACGGGDKQSKQTDASATPATFEVTVTPATQEPSTGEAAPPAPSGPVFAQPKDDARVTRLLIQSAKVDAPLQVKGLNARNEMENPDGKDNIAWYNFTSRPGFGSNAVFSGHVDWYTGEKGVFWHLRDVKEGDEVVLKLSDGMELKYKVVRNEVFKTNDTPVAEIVGDTPQEVITLITCDGTFNKNTQDYSNRRIVRAERIA